MNKNIQVQIKRNLKKYQSYLQHKTNFTKSNSSIFFLLELVSRNCQCRNGFKKNQQGLRSTDWDQDHHLCLDQVLEPKVSEPKVSEPKFSTLLRFYRSDRSNSTLKGHDEDWSQSKQSFGESGVNTGSWPLSCTRGKPCSHS